MPEEEPQEGTVVIGALDTIEDVDDAGCALLGYSKDELVGLHGADLIPEERRPAVAVALDRIRQGALSSVAQGLVMRKGGAMLSVEVTARKLSHNRLALILRRTAARR